MEESWLETIFSKALVYLKRLQVKASQFFMCLNAQIQYFKATNANNSVHISGFNTSKHSKEQRKVAAFEQKLV